MIKLLYRHTFLSKHRGVEFTAANHDSIELSGSLLKIL